PVSQMCDEVSGRCVVRPPNTPTACDATDATTGFGNRTCELANEGRCVPNAATPAASKCEGGTFNPAISGWNMLNLTNFFTTRDNFRQPVVDLQQVVRMVKATGAGSLDSMLLAGQKLDAAHIQYVGVSLGGVVGTLFTAASPDIERSVLNVPGGLI